MTFLIHPRTEVHHTEVTLHTCGATILRYLDNGWSLTHCRPVHCQGAIVGFKMRFGRRRRSQSQMLP